MTAEWIDDAGYLARGKFGPKNPGGAKTIEEVAEDAPDYLAWLLRDVELTAEDAEVIRVALKFRGRS